MNEAERQFESMGLDSATLLTTAELGLMIRNDVNDHNFH